MKELKTKCLGFRATDSDVKLIAALQDELEAENGSVVIRKGIAALAKQLKVKVPA